MLPATSSVEPLRGRLAVGGAGLSAHGLIVRALEANVRSEGGERARWP